MMSYKYDFELSSKRRTFLWLYQVLPSIDLIRIIYKLKEECELEDVRGYHGLCPSYIRIDGSWIPKQINARLGIFNLRGQMNLNTLFMKLIMNNGFICEFKMIDSDYDINQLSMIQNGEWYILVSSINEQPSLRRRIQCINLLADRTPLLSFTEYASIKRVFELYINNDGVYRKRLGIDQLDRIYIPFQVI